MQTDRKRAGWGGRRPGAGRKPIPRDKRLKKRIVYLTDPEWEACMCNTAEGVTPAEYIRHIIQHAAHQRARTNMLPEENQHQSDQGEIAN